MLNNKAVKHLFLVLKSYRLKSGLTRGAMFGLDARIALAIFGALSVISGAALYSAIQESKIAAFHQNILEVGKAWEQYYLDTGQDLEYNSSANYFYTGGLVEDDGAEGWSGPYLNYDFTTTNSQVLVHQYTNAGDGGVFLFALDDTTWDTWVDVGSCPTSETCYLWIVFGGLSEANSDYNYMVDLLEERVDGTIDYDEGDVRWSGNSLYLKYSAIKNPN